MKNTKISFHLILAALAATAALASCTKEITPGQTDKEPVSPRSEGSRVIAVSFTAPTKTTLEDGFQPKFADGDEILLVSYPADSEPVTDVCKVSVDENTGAATISTDLTGDLKALYPAKMVEYAKEDYNIYVPAEQSGKFEDANICQAHISANSSAAVFTNMYALFIIKSPDATCKLTIKSLPEIGADGQRTGDIQYISDGSYSVTVSTPILAMPDSTYYVAINPEVKLSDLSFEAESYVEGTGSIKGIPANVIAQKSAATEIKDFETVQPGIAYTIDGNNWHEYVTLAGRKWATMNIGASSPTDVGYYLAWGATEIAYDSFNGTNFTFKENKPESYHSGWDWNSSQGFSENNTPFADTTDIKYSKYNKVDRKTRLELQDDVAYVNWGGAWRISQSEEFSQTILDNENVKIDYITEPTAGFEVSSGDLNLFLPYAKYGTDLGLNDTYFGGYWCSGISTSQANYLQMYSDGTIGLSSGPNREFGRPIRAIIDEPSAPQDSR